MNEDNIMGVLPENKPCQKCGAETTLMEGGIDEFYRECDSCEKSEFSCTCKLD